MRRIPLPALDRLQIAAPCHEDWNEMAGNNEVRFCRHCHKDVYNLSAMTRRDAERLVAESGGRLCVRYVSRLDKTIITRPPAAPSAAHRRVSRLAASAFTAALAVTGANAQTPVLSATEQIVELNATDKPARQPLALNGSATLIGTVSDHTGAVIPGAQVTLFDPATNAAHTAMTSDEGVYKFEFVADGVYNIEIETFGFKKHTIENVSVVVGGETRADAMLEIAGEVTMMGVVAIASSPMNDLLHHSDKRPQTSDLDNSLMEALEPLFEDGDEVLETLRADVNHFARLRDRQGTTALMLLSIGYEPLVEELIRHGADVNARNDFGTTPLLNAAGGDKAIIKLLVRNGADIHARDRFGVTALMHAALRSEENVKYFIKRGVDVNARDTDGRTALMFAAGDGRTENVKLLIAAGANVNVSDKDGKTALAFATQYEQAEAVAALRAAGAVE